jgi:hypothetical protein
VATLLAWADFDPIKERADDFHSLRACRLISQNLLQSGDLPTVEVRKIGMDRDFGVAWLGFQIGSDLAFSSLQLPQLIAHGTRVAVTLCDVSMSVRGTKQTLISTLKMSAFGGKADIPDPLADVR